MRAGSILENSDHGVMTTSASAPAHASSAEDASRRPGYFAGSSSAFDGAHFRHAFKVPAVDAPHRYDSFAINAGRAPQNRVAIGLGCFQHSATDAVEFVLFQAVVVEAQLVAAQDLSVRLVLRFFGRGQVAEDHLAGVAHLHTHGARFRDCHIAFVGFDLSRFGESS